MKTMVLIPAYNPDENLVSYVHELVKKDFAGIVVVNDGSLRECDCLFYELEKIPKSIVIKHGVNMGKGMALKTGLNHIYANFEDIDGVVTADADGQHHVDDVLKMSEKIITTSNTLIVGVRKFGGDVPWKSRLGNQITSKFYRLLIGRSISDTQSGLRGIPRDLIPKLLKIPSYGYEFELDMLLMCHHNNWKILEEPIKTIYFHENQSSHFNPLKDSMKIYFVLFRAVLVSFATLVIDALVFFPLYLGSGLLLISHFLARLVGMGFQYTMARRFVFYSNKKHFNAFPKFFVLVLISGIVTFALIQMLNMKFGMNVIKGKVISEALIYLFNFTIQRDFIFASRQAQSAPRT